MRIKTANSRSRITNGKSLFRADVDGRSPTAKRFRDLVDGYAAHFGGTPSLPQQNMIRRLASFDMALERHEADIADGKPIDMDSYTTISNAARRVLEGLGLTAASAQPEPPKAPKFDLSAIRFVGKNTPATDEGEYAIRVVAAPVRAEEVE